MTQKQSRWTNSIQATRCIAMKKWCSPMANFIRPRAAAGIGIKPHPTSRSKPVWIAWKPCLVRRPPTPKAPQKQFPPSRSWPIFLVEGKIFALEYKGANFHANFEEKLQGQPIEKALSDPDDHFNRGRATTAPALPCRIQRIIYRK